MPFALSTLKLRGPYSASGFVTAVLALVIDQAHKYWMLHAYGIAGQGSVRLTPFLDLVLVWNPGISYGLLPQDSVLGRALLLAAIGLVIAGLLIWMANARDRLVAIALGAVIGGALGNVIDRVAYGAVADFFSLHAFGFYWYVFNLADVAIVAGVGLLLYDSLFKGDEGGASKDETS